MLTAVVRQSIGVLDCTRIASSCSNKAHNSLQQSRRFRMMHMVRPPISLRVLLVISVRQLNRVGNERDLMVHMR